MTPEEMFTWENGEEEHVVPLIKKYLRTQEQKLFLVEHDITIEDVLNGRVEHFDGYEQFREAMFADWNAKLGKKHFGF